MTILCNKISDRVGSSGGTMMNPPSVQHQGARVPWRPIIKSESGLYHEMIQTTFHFTAQCIGLRYGCHLRGTWGS